MDRQGTDMYPHVGYDNTQPGLEVDSYHEPPKQGWGAAPTAGPDAPYPSYTTLAPAKAGRKTILGLSVVVFWGLVVLLVVLLAGGIGGGVGAGLASRKNTCSR